jgi:hypothetical protein
MTFAFFRSPLSVRVGTNLGAERRELQIGANSESRTQGATDGSCDGMADRWREGASERAWSLPLMGKENLLAETALKTLDGLSGK